MQNKLPPPCTDALEHSERLSARIADEIRASQGWMSFDRFMARALFEPGLGYYSGGSRKFGADGDFITAPEISPLFGRTLARQIEQVLRASQRHVIEVGAGTGVLAADILLALEASDCLPEYYDILELSGELRVRQAETLRAHAPHLLARVRWLDAMPQHFAGCIIANEVLDVMPVQLVVWADGAIFERGVSVKADGGFCWQDKPAEGRLLAAAQALPVSAPSEGEYLSEICLAAQAWVADWAPRLTQGAIILLDYGYPQAEFYLPSRSSGTLQCYYRHRAHPEVLLWPGLNDITAFVDFTAMADAAHAAGLQVAGYTTQASFLTDCGLLDLLSAVGPSDEAPYLRAARAALRLIAPHEMGELFKVLILARNIDVPFIGLRQGDRTHTL